MRSSPSALIALAVVLAILLLQFAYFKLPFHSVFRVARKKLQPPPTTDNQLFQHPFKCDTNRSAVIDSFGTPCLNITDLVRSQLIYAYRSPELSYLYCGIPKNGCTYHVGIMHRLMGHPYEGGFNVHNEENKMRLRPGEEVTQLLQKKIRRYAIVRNPMFRVLSGYLNKVEHKYTDDALKTPQEFRKWVYRTLHPGMGWSNVNQHWRSQVEFCGFKIRDLSSYFTLFRVEKPEEYVNYMEQFLPDHVLKDGWDMPLNKTFRDHVLGTRTRSENTTFRFYEYVGNLRTFDYLRQVYDEDISALGYEEEVYELRRNLIARLGSNR